ncbi:MAG: FG-GAP-like repeat-containing protein, partial [Planctomycetota bacterium]
MRNVVFVVTCLSFCAAVFGGELSIPRNRWRHLSTGNGDLEIPTGRGAEQTATLIVDIDLDGLNDFVICDRAAAPSVTWYRRDTTGWTRHIIDDEVLPIEAGGVFFDVDDDGDFDVVEGAGGTDNKVWWWENPYPNLDPVTPWTRREIKSDGENKHHDCAFGDVDGDGKPEFVFWNNFRTRPKLFVAEIPEDPRNSGPWERTQIYEGRDLAEGLEIADIDGDSVVDIVAGGFWFQYEDGDYITREIDREQAFSRIAVGQLIPGGRPEIVMVRGDHSSGVVGTGPIEMFEWDGSVWVETQLEPALVDHGHSLAIVDFNRDGHLDIFNAEMDIQGNSDAAMRIYYGDSTGSFELHEVSTGFDNHESKVGDLDGDGDLDILGKPFERSPGIDIWLNEGLELGVLPIDQWVRHSVDADQPWLSLFAVPGDFDGDGFNDIASGGWWYRSDGDDYSGDWERRLIG